MQVILLDYSDTSVHIYNLPSHIKDNNEEIEDWIYNETNHKASEINWMTLKEELKIIKHE